MSTEEEVKLEMPQERSYNDEVIGKRVEIMFDLGDGNKSFFPGVVRKATVCSEDNERHYEHFVKFDDGDKCWFDLAGEEACGRLKWLDESEVATTTVSAEGNPHVSDSDSEPSSKKQKTAESSSDESLGVYGDSSDESDDDESVHSNYSDDSA